MTIFWCCLVFVGVALFLVAFPWEIDWEDDVGTIHRWSRGRVVVRARQALRGFLTTLLVVLVFSEPFQEPAQAAPVYTACESACATMGMVANATIPSADVFSCTCKDPKAGTSLEIGL